MKINFCEFMFMLDLRMCFLPTSREHCGNFWTAVGMSSTHWNSQQFFFAWTQTLFSYRRRKNIAKTFSIELYDENVCKNNLMHQYEKY